MGEKPKIGLRALEERVDLPLFERMPMWAVARLLQCVNLEGDQVFDVPKHVLAELARRFTEFMDGNCCSLDEAFGGRTVRQRNALNTADRDYAVIFAYTLALEKAREMRKEERSHSTPSECAETDVAERFGMSAENVRRIWKASRKR